MKKMRKKMSLNRETLRHLQAPELQRAAGGGQTFEIDTTCACTDTCNTDHSCNCSAGCTGSPTNTCTQEFITTCVC